MSTVASEKALERWITVAAAADVMQLSKRRILEFIADGRLKAKAINPRMYLVDRDDAERLAQTERPPGRPRRNAS